MERYWHERTIKGTRYQFEAEVDGHLWRVNLHQKTSAGPWNRLHGSWTETPNNETIPEALAAYVDRFESYTKETA